MQSLDRLRRFASMFGRRDTRHSDSSLSGQSDSESPGSADHHAAPIQPGDILGGRFKVLGFLGQGGMGCVYAAEDILLRTSVAVKVIRSEYVADEGRRSRLIREVRLGRLQEHEAPLFLLIDAWQPSAFPSRRTLERAEFWRL